ncbi:MAG TPA: ESPR domain-containing protein, partial [Negativicutes bacterium]|nr:ESPR domain-containing protein [Negativicutes bacterium]
MNRIYKVVWNRTRACWQVVSELAKSVGRRKAVGRRGPGGVKRLAAALAVLLACTLGGGMARLALAAEGETTASGVLSYGDSSGGYSKSIFADWPAGNITQAGSSFNT